MDAFKLDPTLANDTVFVCAMPRSDVLLVDDARFPWLILVPRLPGMVELHDLEPADLVAVLREAAIAGRTLKSLTGALKINTGALGNIVRQLHIHVVARKEGDPAWPGPVWGSGPRVPYVARFREGMRKKVAEALGAIDLAP
jgi:diadenosine tetraphosphate (Ap4A) HIT family hydrolase